jgi:Fur family peroxide stress response transcriptional regulator
LRQLFLDENHSYLEDNSQHIDVEVIKESLKASGLKVTPQRMAIYREVCERRDHPTADKVYESIASLYPAISLGTVYKTLDTLVKVGLLSRVATEEGLLRYDANPVQHHHLYFADSGEIIDYYDDELASLIRNHLNARNIKDFEIQNVHLHITGRKVNPGQGAGE